MNKLRFGTGGYPLTTKEQEASGAIRRIRELGLEHMEFEFVHQVFIKQEQTQDIVKTAVKEDVSLSIHGSYYVNLATEDKKKWHGSISRIVSAAIRGAQMNAKSVTYHSGFLQGRDIQSVYPLVKEGTMKVLEELRSKSLNIRVSPELTGKPSQFGDLKDLIRLVKDLRDDGYTEKEIGFCFDFAHKYARSNGGFNSYDEFMGMLDEIVEGLGEDELRNMHIHISGIDYSEKGEKNHLIFLKTLEDYKSHGIEIDGIKEYFKKLSEKRFLNNDFKWQELLKALKKSKVGGYVVCESPILELDALLMKKYYEEL